MLTPETTTSGLVGKSTWMPNCTQSAGYPLQVRTSTPPIVRRSTLTGSNRVIALATQDRSWSGTTTETSPSDCRARAKGMRPGASMPSSLESRMRIPKTVPGNPGVPEYRPNGDPTTKDPSMRRMLTLVAALALAGSACTLDSTATTSGGGLTSGLTSGFNPRNLTFSARLGAVTACDAALAHFQAEALERVGPYGLEGG